MHKNLATTVRAAEGQRHLLSNDRYGVQTKYPAACCAGILMLCQLAAGDLTSIRIYFFVLSYRKNPKRALCVHIRKLLLPPRFGASVRQSLKNIFGELRLAKVCVSWKKYFLYKEMRNMRCRKKKEGYICLMIRRWQS